MAQLAEVMISPSFFIPFMAAASPDMSKSHLCGHAVLKGGTGYWSDCFR